MTEIVFWSDTVDICKYYSLDDLNTWKEIWPSEISTFPKTELDSNSFTWRSVLHTRTPSR